ncbi:hypothetical protein CEXT_45551 [Caerostris extrusa]|uniref:Uncharacterized protein n=1 Tax=Caerostris extrusa TaxID=172846 RepID=A0AAV4NIH9_CAEEX|nr:hypothetical protein CEXT_45551 [Caerostris extrusa]
MLDFPIQCTCSADPFTPDVISGSLPNRPADSSSFHPIRIEPPSHGLSNGLTTGRMIEGAVSWFEHLVEFSPSSRKWTLGFFLEALLSD